MSQRRKWPASLLLLPLSLLTAALAFGCGSPSSSSQSTVAAGTPNATATFIFAATNRKLAANHEPTLAPGTDPVRPFANVTYAPTSTSTPGPSPTPIGPSCGATIAGWPQILAKYGGFYKGNGCGVFDSQLVIATSGANGGPGAIATYQCQVTDASCLRGDAPQAPNAAWSVWPAPYPGVIEIYQFAPPDVLLLMPGQYCFNLGTHAYILDHACFRPQ